LGGYFCADPGELGMLLSLSSWHCTLYGLEYVASAIFLQQSSTALAKPADAGLQRPFPRFTYSFFWFLCKIGAEMFMSIEVTIILVCSDLELIKV